jgi:hypothetical protein
MVEAITHAGAEFNLRPAGEDRFMGMWETVMEKIYRVVVERAGM